MAAGFTGMLFSMCVVLIVVHRGELDETDSGIGDVFAFCLSIDVLCVPNSIYVRQYGRPGLRCSSFYRWKVIGTGIITTCVLCSEN